MKAYSWLHEENSTARDSLIKQLFHDSSHSSSFTWSSQFDAMGFPFHITEHVIDAQYVRDHARATATPDAPLKLCIKKYSPVDNPNPQPGDITFVATHGIIFPKVRPLNFRA